MSKGKYNRKRKRAKEKAEQQAGRIGLADAEVVPADDQTTRAKGFHPKGDEKEKGNMASGEIPKGNTLTNWLLVIFTGMLTAVASFQWFVTNRQLAVMRNDQRAWIEVQPTPAKVEIVEGKLVTVPVKVINTRQNTRCKCSTEIGRRGRPSR